MMRFAELSRRTVGDRAWVDQISRIELIAAVVALVTAGLRIPADRTRALDVPVGQGVSGRRRERTERGLLDQTAVVVERTEEIRRNPGMVLGGGAREGVVANTEVPQILAGELVVSLRDLTRRDAFAIRREHHRRPMLVRPPHLSVFIYPVPLTSLVYIR